MCKEPAHFGSVPIVELEMVVINVGSDEIVDKAIIIMV